MSVDGTLDRRAGEKRSFEGALVVADGRSPGTDADAVAELHVQKLADVPVGLFAEARAGVWILAAVGRQQEELLPLEMRVVHRVEPVLEELGLRWRRPPVDGEGVNNDLGPLDEGIESGHVVRENALALFFTGAAMLPPLCLLLSPAAAVLLFAYSYTKRFTWLCHFFLGAVCAAASFGGWLGITGYFEWQILPLAAANGAWVAGFDIVYAVQDMEHDRRKKLYSIPARFGKRASFVLAVFLHIFSFLLLAAQGVIMGSGIIYFTGVAVIGALFIYQHAHTLRTAFGSVNYAVYSVNKAVALVLLAAVVIDEFAAFLLR